MGMYIYLFLKASVVAQTLSVQDSAGLVLCDAPFYLLVFCFV